MGRALRALLSGCAVALWLPAAAAAGWASLPCSAAGIPGDYDSAIRKAVSRYMQAPYKRHSCIVKAQFWVESRLDPEAVSPVGAGGIAQIMPATFRELQHLHGVPGSRFAARTSIRLGTLHLARQVKIWAAPRSHECRLELAQASYNAGARRIIDAQKESGGRRCWADIAPHLHKVTGRHSHETLAYVSRIWAAWRRLRGWTIGE